MKHSSGHFAVKSELDIFAAIPSQISKKSSRFDTIPPVSNITPNSAITIIAPKVNSYTDLSKSFFVVKLKIVKEDGSSLPEKDSSTPPVDFKVSAINYLAHTLFKQIDLSLNGV